MRRKAAALVLAVLLVFQLACGPARAAENVYFTAINDNMLPLSDDGMPFWSNGYLYVNSAVFTMEANTPGRALGIYRSWNRAQQLLVMSSDKDVLKLLFFDLAAGTAKDNQGISYYPAAIQRNNAVYVPLALITYYFDLSYSRIRVPHGYLVRIKNDRAALSDDSFVDAATYLMEPQYNEYMQKKDPPRQEDSPAVTPEDPVTEEPAAGSKTLYLCLEAAGDTAGPLLDELDRAGDRAAFYCGLEFLEGQGGLLRRMAATGQSIGLLAEGGDPDRPVLEQLAAGNRALYEATCGKTRLVYLRNGTDQERQEIEAAGYRCLTVDLDRSGYHLKSTANAAQLLERSADRRGDRLTVWLADTADAAGLRALLSAAEKAGDRCMAVTETTR